MRKEPTDENVLVASFVKDILEKKAVEFGVPNKRLVPVLAIMLDSGEITTTDIQAKLQSITEKENPTYNVPVSKSNYKLIATKARTFKTSIKRLLTALVLMLDDEAVNPEVVKKYLLGLQK